VALADPLKRKQLKKGLDQLSEEGVVQIFRQPGRGDANPILGAVGSLQFEVLEHRIKTEYNVALKLERLPYVRARWLQAATPAELDTGLHKLSSHADCACLEDRDNLPVVLFKSEWSANWAQSNYGFLSFLVTAPTVVNKPRR
jgi:peptide chain release factor 3